MRIKTKSICGGVLAGIFVMAMPGASSISAAEITRKETAFFESKVRPLLVKHCYDCHSKDAEKIKGGLLLDSRDGWMAGGDSGDVIEPGNAAKCFHVSPQPVAAGTVVVAALLGLPVVAARCAAQ